MVKPKRQSKRVPLARKYNIHHKAKEQERKLRRAAKKNPNLRKKLRKDLGIPNLNPFKAEILRKLEEQQKRIKFTEAQRSKRLALFASKRGNGGEEAALASIAADAASRGDAFTTSAASAAAEGDGTLDIKLNAHAGEQTRRAFYKHVKALLEKADIVLEVLDARDPLSCRAPAIEALALAQDPPKRIVLVLNKIDLVPPEVVRQWLAYLRREFPTVAFKASTQQQREHLSAPGGGAVNKATEAGDVVTGTGAAGADTLLQLVKNYSRSRDMKTAVTVGVVGYPNVGKSSVINSLKRGRAVGVSSTPGFTRELQEVRLDGKITLIDCPGIIFDDGGDGKSTTADDGGAGLLLRNCVSVDAVDDPEAAVDGIVRRCMMEKLMVVYSIGVYDSTADFLAQVAVKRGKLGKGGVPDRKTAAKLVLQDWNSGRIPFYVLPPLDEVEEMDDGTAATRAPPAAAGSARGSGEDLGAVTFVSDWGKEFDFASLLKDEDAMLTSMAAEHAAAGSAGIASAANERFARSQHAIRATSTDALSAAATFIAEGRGDDDGDDDDDDDDEDDEDMDDDDEEEEEEDEEHDVPARASASAAAASHSGGSKASGGKAGKHDSSKKVTFASAAKHAKGGKAAGKSSAAAKGARRGSAGADAYDFSAHFK